MVINSQKPMMVNNLTVYGNMESDEAPLRLNNIELRITPGEWLYIVGVNGSGKSTLARVIAGLYSAGMNGEVDRGFAGEESSPIVLQQPRAQLFGETPREEVLFALEWKGIKAVDIPYLAEQALARTGLTALADEPWERLSGGQQQLAAIAASTATTSSLIVLDEVTSMLDEANRRSVEHIARELHRKGTAVVWVTQRLDEIESDSRVIAIGEGSIIYDGKGRDFLYGNFGESSPCERCGLRLPYMAALAIELKRLGQLEDPLPVSGEQWIDVLSKIEAVAPDVNHVGNNRTERINDGGYTSSLCFQPGTLTVLMGPNGVGKTTWMEKLAGLRAPEGLRINYGSSFLWEDRRFGKKKLSTKALLQYGYASQSPEDGLFARSVQDELAYSLRPYKLTESESSDRFNRALEAVGWDSPWLGRDPYFMSGGERRRVALATVFVTPAPWLLLDEPTAGLDGAGHKRVAQQLALLKAEGKGILLVSHDSDWALPIADQVALMKADGSVRLCSREQLLIHPEWIEETGMKVPDWLVYAHLLWSKGSIVEQLWKPQQAAREQQKLLGIAVSDEKSFVTTDLNSRDQSSGENTRERISGENSIPPTHLKRENKWIANQAVCLKIHSEEGFNRGRVVSESHRLASFDPRAIWLAYILLSTGLFLLTDWVSVALGGLLVSALLLLGRISLRRWRGLILNYVFFSVMTSVIFALGAGGGRDLSFVGPFADTLFTFVRTMLVLILGLAIPLVLTPLALRKSLAQILSFRGRTPVIIHKFILIVTLMIRFVPVLLTMWERFNRIFLARGKTRSSKPGPMIRRLREVSLPFLLALFRLGDEVTLALESRGIGAKVSPTPAQRLIWRWRDYGIAAGAAGLSVCLWLLGN